MFLLPTAFRLLLSASPRVPLYLLFIGAAY